jgi:copper chaperone
MSSGCADVGLLPRRRQHDDSDGTSTAATVRPRRTPVRDDPRETHMNEMTLSVSGMTCDHCVRAVSGSLADVPGVETVAVDLASKTVRVTGDADAAKVTEAITDAGYELAP